MDTKLSVGVGFARCITAYRGLVFASLSFKLDYAIALARLNTS
ncbi:MAG: hypothetical protein ACJAYF_002243 [Arenicella sp.]|jgi:hypothetical protein